MNTTKQTSQKTISLQLKIAILISLFLHLLYLLIIFPLLLSPPSTKRHKTIPFKKPKTKIVFSPPITKISKPIIITPSSQTNYDPNKSMLYPTTTPSHIKKQNINKRIDQPIHKIDKAPSPASTATVKKRQQKKRNQTAKQLQVTTGKTQNKIANQKVVSLIDLIKTKAETKNEKPSLLGATKKILISEIKEKINETENVDNEQTGLIKFHNMIKGLKYHSFLTTMSKYLHRTWDMLQRRQEILFMKENMEVSIRCIIQKDGEVTDIAIIESSGNEKYDQIALKLLRQSSPLPPLPNHLKMDKFPITLTFSFKASNAATNFK